jgi:hypothetical protein
MCISLCVLRSETFNVCLEFIRTCGNHPTCHQTNMASEAALIKNLKTKINRIPYTRIKKLWSNGMNRDIDVLIVTHGIPCFFEIKQPGEEPTDWQRNQLRWWSHSGAVTGWYDDMNKCVADVQAIADRAAKHQATLHYITTGHTL